MEMMVKTWKLGILFRSLLGVTLCAAAHMSAAQTVFLCKRPDGRQQYQDAPCAAAAEVETGWTKQRQKEQVRRDADARIMAEREEDLKRAPENLKACVKDQNCSINLITGYMRGLGQREITDALGPPESIQQIGGELWYYTVVGESAGARRRVKLQLEFWGGENRLTRKMERIVQKVNVY